ncbi:MAG: O-antigen ligase family protein [Candidatus Omnitrophica bacterium]|nr:O-antigen ligase family protein [Candidatus Omnitrophota bacterium]
MRNKFPVISINWNLVFLVSVAVVVLFRLVVWKFFLGAGTMVKEDLSNLLVASVQLALGAAFAALAVDKRIKLLATGFEWPLGVLLVISLVSLCYTLDLSVSIRVWLPLAGSMAMFYILANTLDDIPRIKLFLYFILACAFVSSFYGIQEFFLLSARQPQAADLVTAEYNHSLYYILQNRRATSFLGWPNSLAGYLLLILPFAGLSIVTARSLWRRLTLGVVFAVLVGCLLVTFSFLGWFNFLLATAILLPFMIRRYVPRMNVWLKCSLIVLGAVFIGLFIIVIMRKNFAGSILPRLEYYSQAWRLIQERPWEGFGFGSFGLASRFMVDSVNSFTNYVHNVYLQWWVECGVLGLAGILALVGVFIKCARRVLWYFNDGEAGFIALAVVWGLTAFFIDNCCSFTFTKPNIAVHGWAILGVFAALYRQTFAGARQAPESRLVPVLGLLACAGAGIVAALICVGLFFFQAGSSAMDAGKSDEAGKAFVTGSLFDRWSACYPLAAGDVAAGVFSTTRKEYFLRLAETNYLEAVRREPSLYNGHLMLSRVYLVTGESEKALSYAREAIRLSPFEYNRDVARMTRAAQTPAK